MYSELRIFITYMYAESCSEYVNVVYSMHTFMYMYMYVYIYTWRLVRMIMRVYNSNALRCVVCGDGKDYHAKNFSRMMKVFTNSKTQIAPSTHPPKPIKAWIGIINLC